jgi:predicted secreted protein
MSSRVVDAFSQVVDLIEAVVGAKGRKVVVSSFSAS